MSQTTKNPTTLSARQAGLSPDSSAEQRIPFWIRLSSSVRTYQNIIFFVLLCICLAAGLLWWRSYRIKRMSEEASFRLEKAITTEELKNMLQVYGVTEIAPFIRYKLANLYLDEEKFSEARKEYEFIIQHFSSYPVKEWAVKKLAQLTVNELWAQSEKEKQINELIQKRNLPRLTIKTNKGEFEVELYEDEAPNTVANFISIIQEGVYSPTSVYEIKSDLGVCFVKTPPLNYRILFENNQLKHQEGSIGIIREFDSSSEGQVDTPSESSKFYIYTSPRGNEELDGKYTIFGKVVKGVDKVRLLVKGDSIESLVINFKRNHEYKPEKIKIESSTITPTNSTPISPTGEPR
ncbi:MAG: peptidylprolyl isomerase [Planctomycetota bacterium]|nr:peptidylprolyl isomerase [Planctomycetota bacterium]